MPFGAGPDYSQLLAALARAYQSAGNEMNTGIGAVAGIAKTGSLPKIGPEGRLIFEEGADSQNPPMAMGDTLIVPSMETVSPRSLAHENVHQQQSREYGFAYPLLSGLGGRLGPLEQEALQKTQDAPGSENDRLADKLELMDVNEAERSGNPLMRALYAIFKGRPQVRAQE